MAAEIEYVCIRRDHFEEGLDRPTGSGHVTRHRDRWAYCAAGKPDEEHMWRKVDARPIEAIRHDIDWSSGGETPP